MLATKDLCVGPKVSHNCKLYGYIVTSVCNLSCVCQHIHSHQMLVTGWIKARNPMERLSFSFNNFKAKYRNRCWLRNDPQSVENEVFCFSPSYSSVLAVHLITAVYIIYCGNYRYISLLSEWENVGAWERLGSNCIIMSQAVSPGGVSVVCMWVWECFCIDTFLISYLEFYHLCVQSFRLISLSFSFTCTYALSLISWFSSCFRYNL